MIQYHPLIHTFHDWFTAFSLVTVYGLFMVGIKLKTRKTVAGLAISRLELMVDFNRNICALVSDVLASVCDQFGSCCQLCDLCSDANWRSRAAPWQWLDCNG